MAITARRARHERASSGARTGGRGVSSTKLLSGSNESVRRTPPSAIARRRPLAELALAEPDVGIALDQLERLARRGEEKLVAALPDPERATEAVREVERLRVALVEPRGGHGAVQLLERRGPAGRLFREGEDRLGVDGHARLGPLEAVSGEDLLVVQDDPVVDADNLAVPDRMVVGREARVALRVVADVHDRLASLAGDGQPVEEGAGAATLLVHGHGEAGPAVGVADRIRSTFRDRGQERLSHEGLVDPRLVIQAISRDSAQCRLSPILGRSPDGQWPAGAAVAMCRRSLQTLPPWTGKETLVIHPPERFG